MKITSILALAAFGLALTIGANKLTPLLDRASLSSQMSEQRSRIQNRLQLAVKFDDRVGALLQDALPRFPNAARIRVSMFRLRAEGTVVWNTPYTIAAPGHVAGDSQADRPLSDMRESLPSLLAGHCQWTDSKAMTVDARAHLTTPVVIFVACPIVIQGSLIGHISVGYDDLDSAPPESDRLLLDILLQSIADQIAHDLT